LADVKYVLYNITPSTTWSLCADVAARLDIGDVPSTSTTPTLLQVKAWLNLAQLDILHKTINDAIPTLWAKQEIAGGTLSLDETNITGIWKATLATDFVRPIEVQYWRASADAGTLSRDRVYGVVILSKEMALAILSNALYAPTVTRPVGWFWNNEIYIAMASDTVKYTNDKLIVNYIKEPDLLADDDYTELPHVFQEYMIQFAIIRAKQQDGKIEELPALTAAYEQGIQLINMQAAQSYYGIRGR